MNKRNFIKTSMLAGASTLALPLVSKAEQSSISYKKSKIRHWVWINPNANDNEETLAQLYGSYYDAGIRGIFF